MSRGPDPSVGSDGDRLPRPAPRDGVEADDTLQAEVDRLVALIEAEEDDDLGNVTALPEDVAYECGWHDGCDYGYRLAQREQEDSEQL